LVKVLHEQYIQQFCFCYFYFSCVYVIKLCIRKMRVPARKKAQGTRRRRRCEGVGEVAGEGRMAGGTGTNDGLIYTTKESAEAGRVRRCKCTECDAMLGWGVSLIWWALEVVADCLCFWVVSLGLRDLACRVVFQIRALRGALEGLHLDMYAHVF